VELFHILANLYCGVVSYPADTAEAGTKAGPVRTEVEMLKEVLRRIMNGDGAATSAQGAGNKAKFADLSLLQLFEALPADIRNLLMRAFPKLKDLQAEDAGLGTRRD